MPFDQKVPEKLKKIQTWFGSIIERAIDANSQINPIAPNGNSIIKEAPVYIAPSPTLKPWRRIEIYNQQYWWRLLTTMQDIFPLVVRLFGYSNFNLKLAMPFLEKYRPHHWSLSYIGEKFPHWIEKEYHQDDKDLVLNAARIDLAYNHSFLTYILPSLKEENLSSLSSNKLYLQPHIHLFSFSFDLFSFRDLMLKEDVEHWLKNDFPKLDKTKKFFFVLFRKKDNNIAYEQIPKSAYLLLSLFKTGASIDEICSHLEQQDDSILQEATDELSNWFQKWTIRQWLVLEKPPT